MTAVEAPTNKATGLARFMSSRPNKGEAPHMLEGGRKVAGHVGSEVRPETRRELGSNSMSKVHNIMQYKMVQSYINTIYSEWQRLSL